MKRGALLLVPLAVAWIIDARGFALAPWVAVATAALAAGLAAATVRRGVRVGPEVVWLAALVGWSGLDAGLRPVSVGAASWLVAAGLVATLLAIVATTPRGAAAARAAVIAAGSAASAWMIAERLALGGRPGGPFDNPNPAATIAMLGLAVVPGLRVPPVARAAAGTLLVAGVVASGSRGALLGACVLAAVWAFVGARRGLRRVAVAVIGVAAIGLAVRLALDRDPLRFERIRIWAVAARTALAELPWGSGPGGFADAALGHNFPRLDAFARYGRAVGVAESDALELAAALGLPGVALGLGLAVSVLRRLGRGDVRGWGVGGGGGSPPPPPPHPLPPLPPVATLAVSASLPRPRGPRLRATPWLAVAAGLAVGVPVAVALQWPASGLARDPGPLLAHCQRVLERSGGDDIALADAEASAWTATWLRPRDPLGWRVLGTLELRRASLRREVSLAEAAARAFARARADNRLDAWAALGEARAHRTLGELGAARRDIREALEIEPNFVAAWLELAVASLESGELGAARRALGSGEAAIARARSAALISPYDRELARADPVMVARLHAALGVRR